MMKAIELHLGSPIYSVTAHEIREYDVDRINRIDGKINIISGSQYSGIELMNVDPEATQAEAGNYSKQTYYFNLDDAEMAQLLEREKAVKYAFTNMEHYQKEYQKLVAEFMFAEPSKPVKQ